ncbi:MAG: cell envelope integrity protein TolA [Proteobacteria bacterium]|nr:cell envelope integrity protein TolA [Pseudomonadota bacterium]
MLASGLKPSTESKSFKGGILISFVLHIVLAVVSIVILEKNAAKAAKAGEIFTVTLEGGEMLGGIAQVPKDGNKKVLTPDVGKDEEATKVEKKEEKTSETKTEKTPESQIEETKEEYKMKDAAVVDDPQKLLEQKKLEEEKKLKAIKEKKEKEEKEKQKKEEEKKKKLEEQKKKEEEEDKKQAEKDKKEDADKKKEKEQRDKQLSESIKKLKNQYEGESADAGGKGFGAASLGGKGMGGGTLSSLEKVAYSNALQKHIKEGWHWLGGSEHLVAKVQVKIAQDGKILDVQIIHSSANNNFDDSVVRAVYKASPVPVAPENLYNEFATVIFTFDSAE